MSKIMRVQALLLCLILFLTLLPAISAEEFAQDLTADTIITGTGYGDFGFLKDKNLKNYKTSNGNTTVTLENEQGIAGLYLLFDKEYGAYTVTDNGSGQSFEAGKLGILHEYLDLNDAFKTAPTSVTLEFSKGAVRLSEIYAFGMGQTPSFVQKWSAPLDGGADIVLFSTHSDDDQLFFAGLIPLYAGEKKCRVQVVMLTDHRKGPYATNERTHEVLNGLWATGMTAYPVFGDFVDYLLEDLDAMYQYYAGIGTSKEELQGFVVEQIRRFKPLVAIGHDLNGEYKHGMHMMYADLLIHALDLAADAAQFPESAAQYGTWDVPKTYLHLYEENQIVIDYDTPLESFDGLTAFQASQKLGYPCHESQQWTWFTRWLNGSNGNQITKVTQIATYNPSQFGLYRSTVGEDVEKNDFLENIVTYAEQERLEQERLEQERLEQERLEQERLEAERLEQERLEQERLELERLEQERLEQQRQEQAQLQAAAKRRRELTVGLGILIILVLALTVAVYQLAKRKKSKNTR